MPKHVNIMTPFQRQVALGTLLGDSSLRYPTKHSNSYLVCYHARKQSEWLELKYQWLLPFSRPIAWESRLDKRDGKVRHGGRFHTISTPEFRELALMLYPGKRKTITTDYLAQITSPVSLACLIGDDGSWDKAGVALATKQFSVEENGLLAVFLRERFDLSVTVQCDKYAFVRITAISVERLKMLCLPFLPPSLHYKLGPPHYKTTLVGRQLVQCRACGKELLDYLSNGRLYCSRRCAGKGKPAGYVTRQTFMLCERCGVSFLIYNKRQTRCKDCRELRLEALPCVICGAPVWHNGYVTCSRSCNVTLGHRNRVASIAPQQQLVLL
jgi:LAGLIDADG DNA endonuclease family